MGAETVLETGRASWEITRRELGAAEDGEGGACGQCASEERAREEESARLRGQDGGAACEEQLEQREESRRELGRKGENAAVRYLSAKGYRILHRNWRCRFGEADIIAKDPDGTVCFIEVKTRRSMEAGLPEEAVTARKRSRYEKIAMCYIVQEDIDDNTALRFDAIAICVADGRRAMLRHHRSCFDV